MIVRGFLSIRRLRIYLRYSIVDIIARVMACFTLVIAEQYDESNFSTITTTVFHKESILAYTGA